MSKPWVDLNAGAIAELPAQLGVYEVAAADGAIVKIGYAGGKHPFGMRTALAAELQTEGTHFRFEFTHAYLTRWQELLMLFYADHGELPTGNAADSDKLGRLSPGSTTNGSR